MSTKRIKVAILKSRMDHQGGLEKSTLRLAEGFKDYGCDVTLLTTLQSPVAFPFDVVNLGQPARLSVMRLYQFDKACAEWLKAHPTTVVFGMDRNRYQTHYRAGNGVHAAYLDRRKNSSSWLKRLSFTLNPLHRALLKFEREAYESPGLKTLFTNSNLVKQEILKYYDTPQDKIRVVHNGVEWKEWEKPFESSFLEKERLCRNLKLDPNCQQLLFIGNEYKRKGLEELLKALKILSRKDVQLSIVGKERNLPYFINLANTLGVKDQVFFFGPQRNVIEFYQLADCLVLPTSYDPFANVTLEALSMGLYVFTTKDNGGSEVLTSESGMVFERIHEEAIAQDLAKNIGRLKTKDNAIKIRNSVSHLDYSKQLMHMIQETLHAS